MDRDVKIDLKSDVPKSGPHLGLFVLLFYWITKIQAGGPSRPASNHTESRAH